MAIRNDIMSYGSKQIKFLLSILFKPAMKPSWFKKENKIVWKKKRNSFFIKSKKYHTQEKNIQKPEKESI